MIFIIETKNFILKFFLSEIKYALISNIQFKNLIIDMCLLHHRHFQLLYQKSSNPTNLYFFQRILLFILHVSKITKILPFYFLVFLYFLISHHISMRNRNSLELFYSSRT